MIWNSDSSKWSLSGFSIRYFDEEGNESDVVIGRNDTLIDLGFFALHNKNNRLVNQTS